ncbi:MAG: hypothetical protein H7A47_15505 [Verrucomicrobiales bacterium]|nr:hypothetical protein [Verrucomicrobiales bacterium]
MSDIPTAIGATSRRVVLGAGGVTLGGTAAAATLAPEDYRVVILVTGGLLLLLVIGVFFLLRWYLRKRKEEKLVGGMKSWFSQLLSQAETEDDRHDIEELREKFLLLLEELHDRDEDVYAKPWYLIIGPSGAGKSWALRGAQLKPLSGEKFGGPGPTLQGSGGGRGTLLMDWWEHKEAFVLDTAGGMVFQEDDTEALDAPAWQSLLALLRRKRSHSPINGVLVVIPAPMLLLSAQEIAEAYSLARKERDRGSQLTLETYAEKLRGQLRDRLVKKLGVRFPVYFLITKSDKIPGFQEFADALHERYRGDKDQEQQILGWSIDTDLGQGADSSEEVEASAIEERIGTVVANVRRCRPALLDQYVGRADGGATVRAAELFSFSEELERLKGKLSRFVETALGGNAARPDLPEADHPGPSARSARRRPASPFLRGIFFTSAMRQGAALDRVRASSADSLVSIALPGKRAFDATKKFFLEHGITGKCFAEKGLVIPRLDVRRHVANQRRALIWSGIGIAGATLIAVAFGGWFYQKNVGEMEDNWKGVAKAREDSIRHWLPIVTKDASGRAAFSGDPRSGHFSKVRSLLSTPAQRQPWYTFAWLFPTSEDLEDRARVKLFEHAVLYPVVDAAREQFTQPGLPGANAAQLAEALAGMLEVELCPPRTKPSEWGDELGQSGARVLDGLLPFVVPDAAGQVATLRGLFTNVYAGDMAGAWPCRELLGARDREEGWTGQAFDQLARLKEQEKERYQALASDLVEVGGQGKNLLAIESEFIARVRERRSDPVLAADLDRLETSLQSFLDRLRAILPPEATLTSHARGLVETARSSVEAWRKELTNTLRGVNGAVLATNEGQTIVWHRVVQAGFDRLPSGEVSLPDLVKALDLLEQVDTNVLASNGGVPLAARLEFYHGVVTASLPDATGRWPEKVIKEPSRIVEEIGTITNAAARAWGTLDADLVRGETVTVGGRKEEASTILRDFWFSRYLDRAMEEWAAAAVKSIREVDPNLSPRAAPSEIVRELLERAGELGKTEAATGALKEICDQAKCRNPDAGEVYAAAAAKRDELGGRLLEAIRREHREQQGWPLDGSGEGFSEEQVLRYATTARSWAEAVSRPEVEALLGEERKKEAEADIRAWLDKFALLVDAGEPGSRPTVARYQVLLPSKTRLSAALPGEVEEHERSVRHFREWIFTTFASVAANASVSFSGKEEGTSPFKASEFLGWTVVCSDTDKTAAEMVQPTLRRATWTVVELIRGSSDWERGKDRGPWFVPVDLKGGRTGRIWLLVQRATRGY